MAEARAEEEEGNTRDSREQVVRRPPSGSGGRPDRRKPEHRHSQGPLSSIRAAIRRTSRSTGASDPSRERDRDRDRRRPEITILSAEPLASTSWFPGASGGFPPAPPPASQIWGPSIPPSIQPPPSYEEVIREKTEEQVLLPSSSSCSTSSSCPASAVTIATQTDPPPAARPRDAAVRRPVRPPRPHLSCPPRRSHVDDITTSQSALTSVEGDGAVPNKRPEVAAHATAWRCDLTEVRSPLTSTSGAQTDQWDQTADGPRPPSESSRVQLERPRPRPRSRFSVQPISSEVRVQTLVKLRDDGLATLAARAAAAPANQEVSQGRYLQELLAAFSADDWGFPDQEGDQEEDQEGDQEEDQEGDQEEDQEGDQEEDQEGDMAGLKARMRAIQQQQQEADRRPEPRPRPRLHWQPAKSVPPTVAPKPKNFSPVPAPRPPPPKLASASETSSANPKPPPRPPVAARTSAGAPVAGPGVPTLTPRCPVDVSGGAGTQDAADQTAKTGSGRPDIPVKPAALTAPRRASAPNLLPKPPAASPSSPDPDPVPPEPAAAPKPAGPAPSAPCPALRKSTMIQPRPDPVSTSPRLPPWPSNVKFLPLRPPPIKSTPGRPPPPAKQLTPPLSQIDPAPSVNPASQYSPLQTTSPLSANQTQPERASKKGPPLPPRPKPGHPLYSSSMKQEVLIVLDNPSPSENHSEEGRSQTAVSPLCNPSQCLLDLDLDQDPHPDSQSKSALEGLGQSDSQSILPLQPPEQREQPDPPPVSGPRCVALFDYEGEEDDDLTFSRGDAIALQELAGQEWGRGQIHGQTGMFPLSFTEVVEPLPEPTALLSNTPSSESSASKTSRDQDQDHDSEAEEWAVALFDFPGQAAEDLVFHKGALIQVTEHISTEWRRGRLGGREGLYPAAFAQRCHAQPIPGQDSVVKGVAKFAFTAASEDELTLKVGDIITEVESVDEQWILGVVGGKRGIAPKNYISLL